MQVVLVYLQPFRRNSLLKCALQPKNLPKTLLLGVPGRSKSSMLIKLKSWCPVLVMISNLSVPIRNRFHTIRANSNKITFFSRGYPSLMPSPKGTKFCHKKLELRFCDLSLHHFDRAQCCDRWTDRRPGHG